MSFFFLHLVTMKLIVSLFIVTLLSLFALSYAREERFFPFLSAVKFANEECMGDSGSPGICYNKKQCRKSKGVDDGTCANGYGTCCQFRKNCSSPIETVTTNMTHLVNPESSTTQACRYEVKKLSNICQIRLDFTTFNLNTGDLDGTCGDTLTISGAQNAPAGPLCGNLQGQHLYLEFGNNDKILLNFYLMTPGGGQNWDIKVTMIKCGSSLLAPEGCSQYYTETSGMVKSFNYAPGSGQQLNSQDYSVCVSTNNMKRITWRPCSGNGQDSFVIAGIPQPLPGNAGNPAPPAADLLTWKDSDCIFDWVEVFGVGKFCGNNFMEQTSIMQPFMLGVHFNEWEIPTQPGKGVTCGLNGALPCSINVEPYLAAGLPTDDQNFGFCLMYQLMGI